ncbi:MAG: hypothetical protein LBS74_06235 [Oscillospiraceae bacterium]|jgi:hypothetical protein|nr:hypothetical protein [Oscillospiraceae bacterium]
MKRSLISISLTVLLVFIIGAMAFLVPSHRIMENDSNKPTTVLPVLSSQPESETDAGSSSEPAKPVYTLPIDFSLPPKPNPNGFTDGYTYSDNSITVKINKETFKGQVCFFADVQISHPSQFRAAFAGGDFKLYWRQTPMI